MRTLLCWSVCAAAIAATAVDGAELARYRVTLDPSLATATVDVSTDRSVTALKSESDDAAGRLQAGPLKGMTLVDDELQFPVAARGAPGVARYSADLRPKPTRHASMSSLTDPPLALTDPRQWLWLPAKFGSGDRVRIEFVLPKGVGVATPWKVASPAASDAGPAFELGPMMLDEDGLIAFGTLAQREVSLGGAMLRLSIASADAAELDRFGIWAEGVWRTARGTVAAPPGSLEQLLIVPIKAADEAVPWGEVRRGTGNSVLALVQHTPDPDELRGDWTLYHELSHLYLPFVGRDRWLSEGFASYYQNVLRARAGVLAPEAAWQQLAEGLARGVHDAKAGETVEEGGRMVTYWAGAALALEWDLALRKASGGQESLDTVLARFAAADLPAHTMWDARGFAAALDRVAPKALGKDHFSASMSRLLARRGFPDYLASFALAGIDPASGKARADAPAELLVIMLPAKR